jgi:hypothetical protein
MPRAYAPQIELYLLEKEDSITRLANNNRHENNPPLSIDGHQVVFHAGDEMNKLTWKIKTLTPEALLVRPLCYNRFIPLSTKYWYL